MHNRCMSRTRGLSRLLDTALDRAVVPGYSRIGFVVRRKSWANDDPAPDALAGKVAMVTGANSGIGKSTAEGLARLGATVLLAVRNSERGEQARKDIVANVPGADVRVEVCDVSNLADVANFAANLMARVDSVDVLVHNAGLMPPTRTETSEGHEVALATHVLGPVLLTERLAPILCAAGGARVIFVSSGGMYTQKLRAYDPEFRHGEYKGAVAYSRTKRMQVAITPYLAERFAQQHISVHSMHPGWADTPGVADSLPAFKRITGPILRTAAEGADTAVWLAATHPEPPTGQFWHDRRVRSAHYLPVTKESVADLERFVRFCTTATATV